jgi:hypothetical protein
VFDAHPGLKVILGHMGEGLPFLLWRISHGLRATMKEETFRGQCQEQCPSLVEPINIPFPFVQAICLNRKVLWQ